MDLNRFNQLYNFPAFVKQASPDDVLRPREVARAAYADPRDDSLAYPCDSAASTWLSALYFAEKRSHYHPKDAAHVEQRLEQLIDYWGIRDSVETMRTQHDALHKKAEAAPVDADYAIVWVDDATGVKHHNYRMKSAAEVKAAAEWLMQYRDTVPFDDRRTIALKILEKAARYGADLGNITTAVEKQAGLGICNPDDVATFVQQRVHLARTNDDRENMQKFAQLIKTQKHTLRVPDTLIKMASFMDNWDRHNGLTGKYTVTIPRPEDILFSLTYKEAQAGVGSACALQTGRVYDKSSFKKIALHDVQSLFGTDIAAAVADGLNLDVEKLAEVAETFPRPDAELFEKMLDEMNIPPISVKHASAFRGFTSFTPEALAMKY